MCETWRKIAVRREDLDLTLTLCGGQSFRWRNFKTNHWIGVFKNLVWILFQEDNSLSYKCIGKPNNDFKNSTGDDKNIVERKKNEEEKETQVGDLLISYLRLNIDLSYYQKQWSDSDRNFRRFVPTTSGIRILNQELIENIFSFICSSNNNIKRISTMVEKLCEFYGEFIAEIDGHKYYSFPKYEKLAQPIVESRLRNEGFGYRAKFITQAACKIKELGGRKWLDNLKKLPYPLAKNELMRLQGVGAKVADCICLMSLGHMEAIPVDTHIFQIAKDIYLPHLNKCKNLNERVYNQIAEHFRNLHGTHAGWANTILFCAHLQRYQLKEEENKTWKKTKNIQRTLLS